MYAAAVRCELHLPAVHSLKEKRRVLRPLIEGLKKRWSLSVAEVDHQNAWQRSVVGVAAVASHPDRLHEIIVAIRDFLDTADDLELVSFDVTHVEPT